MKKFLYLVGLLLIFNVLMSFSQLLRPETLDIVKQTQPMDDGLIDISIDTIDVSISVLIDQLPYPEENKTMLLSLINNIKLSGEAEVELRSLLSTLTDQIKKDQDTCNNRR